VGKLKLDYANKKTSYWILPREKFETGSCLPARKLGTGSCQGENLELALPVGKLGMEPASGKSGIGSWKGLPSGYICNQEYQKGPLKKI
jgi:hypothetical protein